MRAWKTAAFVAALAATALLAGCGRGDEPRAVAAPAVTATPAKRKPAAAPDRAAMTALGQKIFGDVSLSASGKMACATCHSPDHAYGPPNDLAVQFGGAALDRQGLRTVPSLRYVLNRTPMWSKQYQADPVERAIETDSVPMGGFMHDGRFRTLHEQPAGPLLDPLEMANASMAEVARKLRQTAYVNEFRRVFGEKVMADDTLAVDAMGRALERFELDDPSFHPYTSKYDRVLQGREQLDAQETRGLRLFVDPAKGNCASCHTAAPGANGSAPLFTDFSFAALGVPRNPRLAANADPRFFDMGLCGPVRRDQADRTAFCGMFKTPSLRNVAARAAFMHNGVFTDLAKAVLFYAERDTRPEQWYPMGADGKVQRFDDLPPALHDNVNVINAPMDRKAGDVPALTPSEAQDIAAFLRTLTDADVAKPLHVAGAPG